MMAKGEINLLCNEIESLLTDICQFLSQEIQNETISETGRNLASTLIERSNVQLKAISIITSTIEAVEPTNESYVDMQSPKVTIYSSDPQEVYSDVSFEGISNVSLMEDATLYDTCPYENLPATDIKDGKSGFLYRKEKFLFFDQQRKIFAAIQQWWLLIYLSEHALKPSQTFDLAGYNAKTAMGSTKEMKKRDESFSLFSLTDPKSYQFTAMTSKDMLQWVSAINLQSELIQAKRSLPPIPTNIITENTDASVSDSSNDYELLTEYRLKNEQASNVTQKSPQPALLKKPLPLPPRNTQTKGSHIIHRVPSEDSMGDYDCVGPGPEDSFSDENDEDAFYDNPTELKQRANYSNHVTVLDVDNEDEIYDYLQQPTQLVNNSHLANTNISTPVESTEIIRDNNKDTNSKQKHKPLLKPKMLSFSNKKRNN